MKANGQPLKLKMPDGFELSANLFETSQAHAFVLVGSAVGVGQYYYFGIAEYLSSKGYKVLTYDYRGVAQSAPEQYDRHFDAGLKQLSSDFEWIIDWVKDNNPDLPLILLGHSLGGIMPVLVPNNDKFTAIFTVGTQMAYHKDFGFSKLQNFQIYAHWHIVLPILTRLFGYFPGRRLGLGIENLPATLARDIHSRRKYANIFEFLKTVGIRSYHLQLFCPVVALTMSDDAICTPKALNRFFDELDNARVVKQIITPTEVNATKIGHLTFFSRKHASTLWVKVSNGIEEMLSIESKLVV